MKRARRRERDVPGNGCCHKRTEIVIASNRDLGAGGRAARCAAAPKDLDNDHAAAAVLRITELMSVDPSGTVTMIGSTAFRDIARHQAQTGQLQPGTHGRGISTTAPQQWSGSSARCCCLRG